MHKNKLSETVVINTLHKNKNMFQMKTWEDFTCSVLITFTATLKCDNVYIKDNDLYVHDKLILRLYNKAEIKEINGNKILLKKAKLNKWNKIERDEHVEIYDWEDLEAEEVKQENIEKQKKNFLVFINNIGDNSIRKMYESLMKTGGKTLEINLNK